MPAVAAAPRVVLTVGGGLSTLSMVTVSCASPVSITRVCPARKPNGVCRRRAVAPTTEAPLSVVRRALSAYWSITVARSANEVVTSNVLVYLATLPAASCSPTACVWRPTVRVLRGSGFGMTCSPSTSIRRMAAPPAPLATVSVASRRRGSLRSGVSVLDCSTWPSTIDGT